MKKKINWSIGIVLITFIALLTISCASDDEAVAVAAVSAPGTITVEVINAADQNTKTAYFAIATVGANPDGSSPTNSFTIVSGTGSAVAQSSGADVTFPAGAQRDVHFFIDLDGSGGDPNTGDKVNSAAKTITVNGNMKVTVDYNDLLTQP